MRKMLTSFSILTILMIATLSWATPTEVSAQGELPPNAVMFDFDTSNGITLTRGQTLTSITVDGLTMGIEVDSNGDHDEAMIFDTANPGSVPGESDFDLGAPNETCPNPPEGGWPGVGDGGEVLRPDGSPNQFANCEPRGNVLIIPEDVPFIPGVGPDDDGAGGVISLTFDVPVRVLQIDILDIDEPDNEDEIPRLAFLDENDVEIPFEVDTEDGIIQVPELNPKVAGDNGYEEFRESIDGVGDYTSTVPANVWAIRGTFVGSGALANIVVIPNPGEPLYEFRKYVNGFDANLPEGSDTPHLLAGTPVTWTYHVTNTGQVVVPFASLVVTDSDPNVDPVFNQVLVGNDDLNLDPDEVVEFIATGTVPDPLTTDSISVSRDLCGPDSDTEWGYRNVATLTIDNAVELTDPAHICIPHLSLYEFRKFVNGFDANLPEGNDTPHLLAGTPVTWTYHVTNTGEVMVPFASLVVTDSDPNVDPVFSQVLVGNGDLNLDPNEVVEFIATGTVPDPLTTDSSSVSRDLCGPDSGTEWGYRNVATLTIDNTIELTDPAHICIPVPVDITGIRINEYELSYTVTNPSVEEEGVPIENIVVRAASPAVTITCPEEVVILNPGESMVCSATATDIAFRNSLGWVVAEPVGGGSPIIRVVVPDTVTSDQ